MYIFQQQISKIYRSHQPNLRNFHPCSRGRHREYLLRSVQWSLRIRCRSFTRFCHSIERCLPNRWSRRGPRMMDHPEHYGTTLLSWCPPKCIWFNRQLRISKHRDQVSNCLHCSMQRQRTHQMFFRCRKISLRWECWLCRRIQRGILRRRMWC